MGIIPQPDLKQQPRWQDALSQVVTSPEELLRLLALSCDDIAWQWDKAFPLRVPKSFIARMEVGNPQDPLLLQVLSIKKESQLSCGSADPLQESTYNPLPGLLHKFRTRVLLTLSTSCAVHCRFCFRRHFPYDKNNPGRQGWADILDYIAKHPDVIEVILSGGDPLMAQDKIIQDFLNALKALPQIKIVRFHTRFPIVIPERITPNLIQVLKDSGFKIVMVYHTNHAAELTDEIADYVAQLKQANVTVLNQTTLLAGVNDTAEALENLSYRLFESGILPYYVHLLDPVQGAMHFEVSQDKAKMLQQALRDRLPGYLAPKFVREVPGKDAKVPLDLL